LTPRWQALECAPLHNKAEPEGGGESQPAGIEKELPGERKKVDKKAAFIKIRSPLKQSERSLKIDQAMRVGAC
jgi:hypothetical protein